MVTNIWFLWGKCNSEMKWIERKWD